MDNPQILRLLEKQRDLLFEALSNTTISQLYKEQYTDIKEGRVFVFDDGERQMLSDLERLANDNSLDNSYKTKLTEYLELDNENIIIHFQHEFSRILAEIAASGKQAEIQALFIEYDSYYDQSSCVTCFGQQQYPKVEEPRYIRGEYDYNKQVLSIDNGINFQPAWVDCEEFADLEYLDIVFKLERLFQLNSRALLHQALLVVDAKKELEFFIKRPLIFYINEHDCEIMTLYVKN